MKESHSLLKLKNLRLSQSEALAAPELCLNRHSSRSHLLRTSAILGTEAFCKWLAKWSQSSKNPNRSYDRPEKFDENRGNDVLVKNAIIGKGLTSSVTDCRSFWISSTEFISSAKIIFPWLRKVSIDDMSAIAFCLRDSQSNLCAFFIFSSSTTFAGCLMIL